MWRKVLPNIPPVPISSITKGDIATPVWLNWFNALYQNGISDGNIYLNVLDFIPANKVPHSSIQDDTNTTDLSPYIQAALDAAAAAKTGLAFQGTFLITNQLIWSTWQFAGRDVAVPLLGVGYNSAIIKSTVAGYALSLPTGSDYVTLEGMACITTTGGFLNINGDCGGMFFDKFFMNGCAANYYAVNQQSGVIYTADFNRSRFWKSDGYLGGVFNMEGSDGGINIAFRNSFISQQKKDGDISTITNCKNFIIDNVQCEGTNTTATDMCFWALKENNFNFYTNNLYLEGNWNKAVRSVVGSANRGIRMYGTRSWSYVDSPSSTVLDMPTGTCFDAVVKGVNYFCQDTGSGTGYIINDPDNICSLENYSNVSTGNQASRAWKQNPETEQYRNTDNLGNVVSGDTITSIVSLPTITGDYLFGINLVSQDKNHKTSGFYRIIFDNGNINNYADTDILGTVVSKGGLAPTLLSVSVDIAGEVTTTAISNQTATYTADWWWSRMATLT